MKNLALPSEFDWDENNIEKNYRKHRVTVRETEEAFDNKLRYIFKDEAHSKTEQRYALFGQTDSGRLLTVVFILRGKKVRVVSVRDMSRKERRSYEKIKTGKDQANS